MTSGSDRTYAVIYLAFLIISLLVYSRAFDNDFRQDDFVFLKHVETVSVLDSFKPSTDFAFYRPGSLLLFRLEHLIFARNGGAYIAFNYILHVLASIMVIFVIRRSGLSPGFEFIGAGLFLLGFGHYGKTVMWACCSGQIAATIMALAGILLSLRWAGCTKEAGENSRFGMNGILPVIGVALMTAAVLFHDSAVVASVVAAMAVLVCSRPINARDRFRIAFLLLPIPIILVLYNFLSAYYPACGMQAISFSQVPGYLLRYAGFAIIPIQKTGIVELPDILRKTIGLLPQFQMIVGALLLLAMGYLAIKHKWGIRMFSIWFPLAILPFTLVILPAGWLQLRYLYFASIPLCSLTAVGFFRLMSARGTGCRLIAMVLMSVIVLCTSVLVLLLETHYAAF